MNPMLLLAAANGNEAAQKIVADSGEMKLPDQAARLAALQPDKTPADHAKEYHEAHAVLKIIEADFKKEQEAGTVTLVSLGVIEDARKRYNRSVEAAGMQQYAPDYRP